MPIRLKETLPVIEKLRKETAEWPKDQYGELYYGDPEQGGEIYVDGTGMFTPFIAKYASVFPDATFVELDGTALTAAEFAQLQVTNYYKFGVNRITQRAYQGYTRGGSFQGEEG